MIKKLNYIGVLALTSCASIPLSQEGHQSFARNYALVNICAKKGYMNSSLAAHGLNILKNNISRYSNVNNVLITDQLNFFYGKENEVTTEHCNQLAVNIQSSLIQRQQQQESSDRLNQALKDMNESINNNRPRQTNCYSYGYGMTNCTTY